MMNFYIRTAKASEYDALGKLIRNSYASLDGFPSFSENPEYYSSLSNLQDISKKPGVQILVAVSKDEKVLGGIVFFGDAAHYGSGIINTDFEETSGIRLLAVDAAYRKSGIGKKLTLECINTSILMGHKAIMLHSTQAMTVAWGMYERLNFLRVPELDFTLNDTTIYGFIKSLDQ